MNQLGVMFALDYIMLVGLLAREGNEHLWTICRLRNKHPKYSCTEKVCCVISPHKTTLMRFAARFLTPVYGPWDPDPGAFLVDSDCTLTPLPVLADYPLRRLNQHVNTPRD